ncbi:MAG TPA: NAD(P)-binding domain-containing protein [Candidatus Krumholzibacteria bacterium]|nr:NAD(P)-binding domain-containing protein [Candidatus Krumholzibacteria bacterium]
MMMLITTIAFIVFTLLLMRGHMKSRHGDAKSAPCPRCRKKVPHGAARCPSCGVPMQLYEVVRAGAVSAEESGGKGSVQPHAVVRADLCVGCAACVPVCPEPGAIRMVGKLATVNKDLCKGHGKCVEACPVGGIVLATGASVHRVEVPLVNAAFESNIPGVYVVGELGGRGLIKNAINEAAVAMEHVASERTRKHAAVPDDVLDVVIVGSGPAGLSAGLEALRRKLRYVVLEQGALADTIRKYPRAKFLLAEPLTVPLYGNLWVADGSKERLLEVWERIIASTGLEVRTHHRVTGITRENGWLRVDTPEHAFRARHVILAMGRRGSPRRLGVPGEELGKVIYDVVDMESFAGQRMLVVGGGDSAVESAVGLAKQKGTTVVLCYRGDAFARVKERNRVNLEQAVHCGTIRVALRSQVREVRPDSVVLDVGGREEILPNDVVVVRIGGDPPYKLLEEIGVRIVKKDVPLPKEEEPVVA